MAKRETRSYQDRKKYLIKAVAKRRKLIRQKAVYYKGGECNLCGYKKCLEALEFHHLDPLEKDFSLGAIRANPKNWETIKKM